MKYQVKPNSLRASLLVAVVFAMGAQAVAADSKVAPPTKAVSQKKPDSAAKINQQQLAVNDRALKFCDAVDADSAKKLKQKIAELTKGASDDDVARARDSDAYKMAYANMDSFVAQIDPRNAKVACANSAGVK